MRVAHEMRIVEAKDIGIYAEAHRVAKLVKDVIYAAQGREPQIDDHLQLCASTVTAAVVDAMRATDDPVALRRLRQVSFLVDEIRHATWLLFDLGAIAAPLFDEVMITTTACRREVDAYYAVARRTAYRRLAGMQR